MRNGTNPPLLLRELTRIGNLQVAASMAELPKIEARSRVALGIEEIAQRTVSANLASTPRHG